MKTGRDIVDLAQELKRQAASKLDLITDTREIQFDSNQLVLDGNHYATTPHAHGQIAQHTGIPSKYYDVMMREAPHLLKANVEHWFQANPARRMVRTLDGNARAFLSDRYRRLDNEDVAEAALPILLAADNIRIESCQITATRLYIKAVFPTIQREVKVGDIVNPGVVISNSEIGSGSLSVLPMIYRLWCLNGATFADQGMKKYHVGRQVEAENGIAYRDETVKADDKALLMKLQDVIMSASKDVFDVLVGRLQEATEGPRIEKPVKAIEILGKELNLLQGEQESILERLIKGQDYSRYGVMNAITNLANDTEDYDRASELEQLGPRVLDLPNWNKLAVAA